jgi:transcriptional regulator with XRE-family HTH domain
VTRSDSVDDINPAAARSIAEFAALLRQAHLLAGKPTLRDLERREPGPQLVRLTRSTVSAALNGERLPSPETLTALLAALGVTEPLRRRWLIARGRLDQDRTASPRRRVARPVVLVTGAVAVVAALGAVVALTRDRDRPVPTTIACTPATCVTGGTMLTLSGVIGSSVPAAHRLYLFILVQSSQRWYLGPALVTASGAAWTERVKLGNPVVQDHDRSFMICVVSLPENAVDGLVRTQMARAGTGLADADLPPDRRQMACLTAIRPAGV